MVVAERRELATVEPTSDLSILEKVVVEGDLSKLTPDERLTYYSRLCESLSLNPLTQPFEYLRLNGKLVLYAKKTATDQLRRVHGVSIVDVEHQTIGDIYVVTAHARTRAGIEDVDEGAVNIKGLSGESLSNSYMKALTKAKRRVTLSICGLGMLDETEVDSIPGAVVEDWREKYRRKFFALAKGTRYESDAGRAAFMAQYTNGAMRSLREFLADNYEDAAIALLSALELATQNGADVETGELPMTADEAADALKAELFTVDEPDAPEPDDEPAQPAPVAGFDASAIKPRFIAKVQKRGAAGALIVSWDRATAIGELLSGVLQSVGAGIDIARYLTDKPATSFRGLTSAEADVLEELANSPKAREKLMAVHALAEAWAKEQKAAAKKEPAALV